MKRFFWLTPYFYIVIALIANTFYTEISAHTTNDTPDRAHHLWGQEDTDDCMDFFNDDDDSFDLLPDIQRSDDSPDQLLLTILLGAANAPAILLNPFYLATHPLNTRNLLDSPLFFDCDCFASRWNIGGTFFFNQTSAKIISKKVCPGDCQPSSSKFLSSYVALSDPNLIEALQQAVNQLRDDGFLPDDIGNIDLPEIFPLFQCMKLQERRLGIMFNGRRVFNDTIHVSLRIPVYYLEYNFFLTKEEEAAIKDNPLFDDSDQSTNDKEELDKFQKMHFASDQVAFGDTRLSIVVAKTEHPSYSLWYGGEVTIPTGYTIAKDLGTGLGTFNDCNPTPDVNLSRLLTLGIEPDTRDQAIAIAKDQILIGALDRLSTLLLNNPPGNDGHVGIAPVVQLRAPIHEWLTFCGRTAIEYLLPAKEQRFFIKNVDTAALTALLVPSFDDPDEASEFICELLPTAEDQHNAVKTLNTAITERLFPQAYNTVVSPGILFKMQLSFDITYDRGFTTVGYDFWWQGKEKLGTIHAPESVLKCINVEKTQRIRNHQHKFFGSITFKKCGRKRDWLFALKGDTTFAESGIGKDFTLGLSIQAHF